MPRQSNDSVLLFIMRHGEAEAARRDDKSRKLTEFGRSQSLATSHWLQKYSQAQAIDLALVSPYLRTRQTLDVVCQHQPVPVIEISNDIVPDGDIHQAHDYIDALLSQSAHRTQPLRSILLVSHMPLVSYLVDELCHTHSMPLFATGSVAVIEYSPARQRGTLLEHFQGRS